MGEWVGVPLRKREAGLNQREGREIVYCARWTKEQDLITIITSVTYVEGKSPSGRGNNLQKNFAL